MVELLDPELEVDPVEVTDLFCLYPLPRRGTVAALRGLTLTVAAGEKLVVHGPNGSGKTTLLKVLMGELAPSAGSVRVAGIDLAGADDRTRSRLRRDRLGIVDQHSVRVLRPELDVVDNIALQLTVAGVDRAEARERAADWLARLDLEDLAGRDPRTLSGGEAQRVCVCAALVHEPRLVLADEPTGELDAAAADRLYDLLATAAAANGAALVVVSHDVRAARIADRVVRIRDGRLSEQWRPSAPEDEELVVDDRGWVRLPESLRRRAGVGRTVRPRFVDGDVVLRTGDAPDRGDFGRPGASAPADLVAPGALGRGSEHKIDPASPVLRSDDAAPADLVAPGALGRGSEHKVVPESPVPGPVRDDAPAARLRQVSVRFGDRTVLAGLDLDIAPGQLTVLRGRSGSGKSTLLRVLLGLADPDTGRAELLSSDLADLDRAARADRRRDGVAAALQSGSLAESLDIDENLELAQTLRGRNPDEQAAARVITALGLDPVRGRAVRDLSGGERQRVAVARCLVVAPRLVVLDEPTSQQDEAHAELVAGVLRAAADAGMAILAATHDPSLVATAGRVVDLVPPD